MFFAAGNEYFRTTPVDNRSDLSLKILNGTRPLTSTTRTTAIPFPFESMKMFFSTYLNPLKFDRLYNGFDIPKEQQGNNDVLIDSIINVFEQYTIMGEDAVTLTVKTEYDRLYNLPIARKLIDISTTKLGLIAQVGYKCPLTDARLLKTKNNFKFADFAIAKIFPENLTSTEEAIFTTFRNRPHDLDDVDNLIALSPSAAENYYINKNFETFKFLVQIKEKLIDIEKVELELSSYDVEKGLSEVIKALHGIDPEHLSELSYNALKIDEKIPRENYATSLLVRNYVLKYYNFINNYLVMLDEINPGTSSAVAENVKWMSENLQSLNLSAPEIINRLTQTILDNTDLPNKYFSLSKIVVSYFIQHCEVLSHETT